MSLFKVNSFSFVSHSHSTGIYYTGPSYFLRPTIYKRVHYIFMGAHRFEVVVGNKVALKRRCSFHCEPHTAFGLAIHVDMTSGCLPAPVNSGRLPHHGEGLERRDLLLVISGYIVSNLPAFHFHFLDIMIWCDGNFLNFKEGTENVE